MCAEVDYEDKGVFRRQPAPSTALMARTRLVEAGMAGERVAETAWEAFFEPRCGAIDMRSFQRMFEARRIALCYLALQRASHARDPGPDTGLRCIGD